MINGNTATGATPLRKSLRRAELATFLFALFMVAAMALPRMAAAISFGVLGVDSGPCILSSGLDAAGFCQDIGIDYNPLFDNIVTSVHYTPVGGDPNAYDYINRTTGARTPIQVGLVGDERKLTVVRQVQGACTQQWPVGTIFTGNGTPGQIMRINPDGTFLNPWKILPGEGGILRGGIYHDRWCVAGGDVIVVTGSSNPNDTVGGTVWRVPEVGLPTLLKTILHPGPVTNVRAHLEGVITVPNAPQFGPWAGKILTGDEARVDVQGVGELNGPNPKIYTIDPTTGVCDQNATATNSTSCNATFTFNGVVPHPEDFDYIEGDFYGVAYKDSNSSGDPTKSPDGYIFTALRGSFPGQVDPFPDIMITQEYPVDQPGINQIPAVLTPLGTHSGLYQIRLTALNTFTATELELQNAPQYTQWEHVTFTSPRVKISIAPNATNEVGASHTFTVTLQKDVGAGFVAAAGEHVTATLTNSNGANFTNVSGTCTNAGANTNAAGQCTITFTSLSPGKVTGHAAATLAPGQPGAGIHVETDGTFLNSVDAVKTFVDANIQITPATATNPVNTNHTLTGHVNINDGSGIVYSNAPAGTLITFSIQSGPGSFVGGTNTCNTIGATGSCSVQITSATAGTTVVRASTTVNVGGVLLTRTTGDGKAGDSADASKTWIAPRARISIAPNATNEVGSPHTFTVTLEKDPSTGTFVPAAGEHVDVTLTDSNGAVHTAPTGTCTNAGANTNASGQCTITFNSNSAGKVTGTATASLTVSGVSLLVTTNGQNGNSAAAVKTYVNANIQITPATATNPVNTNHTLTGHVNVNAGDGAGFVNAPAGTQITFSIQSGPGSFVGGTNTCTTIGGTGSCTAQITSSTAGTTVVSASTTITVGGVSLTRTTNGTAGNSGNASKTWETPPSNKTRTQGYWGNKNGLATLNALKAAGVTSVTIGNNGGTFTITFNNTGGDIATRINNFMPQGSTPLALTQSYTNPTKGTGSGQVDNVFVGQVLALQLNVLASDNNIAPLVPGLKNVVLPTNFAGVTLPANYTIGQVLADANKALGGGGLPSYASSISVLNNVVDAINNLFDN